MRIERSSTRRATHEMGTQQYKAKASLKMSRHFHMYILQMYIDTIR